MEYGAARCSAKCTMASGWWHCTTSETNSQSNRSPNSKPMVCPLTSRHAPTRSFMSEIGVRLTPLNSWSMVRLTQLSTITTSWPTSERCKEVGQPQYPSPPRTSTFITLAPFLLYKLLWGLAQFKQNLPADDCSGKIVRRVRNQCKRSVPLFLRSGTPASHSSDDIPVSIPAERYINAT